MSNKLYLVLVIVVLICSAALFGLGTNWGIPSNNRLSLVFRDSEEAKVIIDKTVQELTQTRHEREKDLLVDEPRFLKIDISEEPRELLKIYRRYLLYPENLDDVRPLMVLSRFNIRSFEIHPHHYNYGGAFLYPLGILLFSAGKLGFITLTHNHADYLSNPSSFGSFFIVGRLMVVAAALAGVFFTILVGSQLLGRASGILAGILLCSCPALVNWAHDLKPHAYSICFICLTLYFSLKLYEQKKGKFAFFAGVSCGLAVGSIPTLIAFLFIPIVSTILSKRVIPQTLMCIFGFILSFSITNFYFFLTPMEFIEEIRRCKGFYPPITSPFDLIHIVPLIISTSSVFVLILFILGAFFLWRKNNANFFLLMLPSFLFVVFIIITIGVRIKSEGSVRFLIPLLPILCVIASATLRMFLEGLKNKLITYLIICFCVGGTLFKSFPYTLNFLDNFTKQESGKWINNNIPERSSIGAIGSFSPIYAPGFQFSRFRLFNVPLDRVIDRSIMPDYIVYAERPFVQWEQNLDPVLSGYEIVKVFKSRYHTPLSLANDNIFIYRLKLRNGHER